MSKLVATVVCSALLVLGGLAGDLRPAQAQKTTDITFSLDFIVLGRHAPLFVAIEKGFYKEEGLNVTMIPAKGTAAAIQNVESKVAHLGFIDVPSLVIARAGGATVKVVSVIYQKSPFTIFSLDPGANVTSLKGPRGAHRRLAFRELHLEHRQGADAQERPRSGKAHDHQYRAFGTGGDAGGAQGSVGRLLHHDPSPRSNARWREPRFARCCCRTSASIFIPTGSEQRKPF